MSKVKSGVIKQILKDHFDGFWRMQSDRFPESYREDIKETVEKAIRCRTSDLGYARYECLRCEGNPKPIFVCFTCKSRFCHLIRALIVIALDLGIFIEMATTGDLG
ncbi:transposase zinc-binding domain-containing protein [Bacillus sp. EB600]|uniref:transposase zinc-binding domain-containing protein n=1 Tax=Bacillus sp. EB600 TaxID=2806345 RepID=UPI00210980F3|nr:transposase zinc-binding domain-containing protein [Bacillus sp. EB600]MCQ6282150.1 transposase zinc-binding domain-containing protein [Bacillus sp. EB600]